ncbi:MAG: hypothetical protein U1E15_06115 [Hyphomicrobiales bacterium]
MKFRSKLCRTTLAFALLSGAAPALAQTATCTPDQVNALVDGYTPYSAAAWRVMAGLGNTGLDAEGPTYGSWNENDAWKKRTAELAPEMQELQDVQYDCRTGYPLSVLNERVAKLGATDPYIKQWLSAQARVLKACSGAAGADLALPAPLEVKPELAQMQMDDRAYQEASVAFYADKAKAVQLFKAIGAGASPHKAAARYNVANLLANGKDLAGARAEAAAILADASLASVHPITRELQGYIANLEDTAEGWSTLIDNTMAVLAQPKATIMASERGKKDYANAAYDIDFVGVKAKESDWWVKGTLPENPTLSKALVDASRKYPMALWMMAGQSVNDMYGKAPWALVGPTWQSWAQSYVDGALAIQPAGAGVTGLAKDTLVALRAGTDDASRAALWAEVKDAAAKTQSACGDVPESAAFSMLLIQAVRVSAMSGHYDEIYDAVNASPALGSRTVTDIVLPKLMQHLLASGNAEEGRRFRDKVLTPALFETFKGDDRQYSLQPYADFLLWVAEDQDKALAALALSNTKLGSSLLNLQSAKTLRQLSGNDIFNQSQKALLQRAAWTRDYARGRSIAKADTAAMLAANPDIKSAFEAVKTATPKLRDDRAWALTILRNPRMGVLVNSPDWTDPIEVARPNFAEIDQYDHNDKNWWCPLEPDRLLGDVRKEVDDAAGLVAARDYNASDLKPVLEADGLAKAEAARDEMLKSHPWIKAVNWSEVASLAKAPSAPQALGKAAVRWAKASKGDDGAPEALALAVKVTHYGCSWHGGNGTVSKAAQELLQARFAGTPWAKDTPYWFDCMDMTYDAQSNKVTTCKPRSWPKQAPLR